MKIKKKDYYLLLLLLISVIVIAIVYLFINTRGNLDFALSLRGPKVLIFIIVGLCTGFATIPFQTMTENRLLTPSIIGIDSLYVFFQTAVIFFVGAQSLLNVNQLLNFTLSTILVTIVSLGLYYLFFKKFPGRLLLMLMFGMILGTLTNSLNTFLQVIMDPNEFTLTLSRTMTSFNQVNQELIWITVILALPCITYLFVKGKELDVIHLGRDYASSLGIDVNRQYLIYFIHLTVLTALATSLVGPVSFLGFLGANVTYRLFSTYQHRVLLVGSSLVTILFILIGQILVEHLFKNQTTIGVIIDFIGGIYFLFLLLKERSME